MIYEGVVYFAGPMTVWGGQVAEHEVVFRARGPWLWVVRMQTLSAYRPLDHSCVGFQIKRGDLLLAHAKAEIECATPPETSVADVEALREFIRKEGEQVKSRIIDKHRRGLH
jgi:hypothetical protein